MNEVELTDRLDQAIEVMVHSRLSLAPVDFDSPEADLIDVAMQLRGLPRQEFKARLREELEAMASLGAVKEDSVAESSVVRKGFRTVTPYIVVSDVHQEIAFIEKVFAAQGKVYGLGSQGGYHSEYRIGDSMLMIGGGGEGSKWQGVPVPASLHAYVPNVDDVYQAAVDAGATSLMPPTDMTYGERGAAIEDPGGNHWYLATAFGASYVPKGLPEVIPFFNPVGAPQMVRFLKEAFNAEEIAIHRSPKGTIAHAELRIGDAVVEMGEAHGQWQSRPMHFMFYVEDSDEAYARAMRAEGAISVSEPANAPYGGRTGVIKDPWDNIWYLSSPEQKKER